MGKYYVYVLRRPDKMDDDGNPLIFYVGKGKGNRIYEHTHNHRMGHSCIKDNVILKLLRNNLEPICEKVIVGLSEGKALKLETHLIKFFGRIDLGTGILTNLTDGGDGFSNLSDETRRRHKKCVKKAMTKEVRKKMSKKKTKYTAIINGEEKTLIELAKEYNFSWSGLVRRYNKGYRDEELLYEGRYEPTEKKVRSDIKKPIYINGKIYSLKKIAKEYDIPLSTLRYRYNILGVRGEDILKSQK